MEKRNITLTLEEEKLDALEFSLKKKGSSVQRSMQEALNLLYEQEVAAPVREYLESRSASATKPKRSARSAKPSKAEQHAPSALAPSAVGPEMAGD